MKLKTFILFLICFTALISPGLGQNDNTIPEAGKDTQTDITIQKSRINFFIVSKRKKGKLDLATRYNVLRSKIKAFFCRSQFVAIIAGDSKQASAKIIQKLRKNNASLGTVWFDSHGMYKKGYSLFFIGKDEISYTTLKDSSLISTFSQLSPYTGSKTRFVIGSCYGGATYTRSSVDYKDTTRMNGDSLMISLGKIIRSGKVFASESWVMTKPGLFRRRPAVGGFPGRKLFRDVCYEPVWKNMGVWNQYDATAGEISQSNPVSLDRYGNLIVRGIPYKHEKMFKKSYFKKLTRLQANLYK